MGLLRHRALWAVVMVVAALSTAVALSGVFAASPERFADCTWGKDRPVRSAGPNALAFDVLPAVARAMQRSDARGDYVTSGFEARSKQFVFAVRMHAHDDAIRACGKRLGYDDMSIVVHRWRPSDIDRAGDQLSRDLPSLRPLFYTSRGTQDALLITVRRRATAGERARITAAAKSTGVSYQLLRDDLRFDLTATDVSTGTVRDAHWGVTGSGPDGRTLMVQIFGDFSSCDDKEHARVRETD